MSWLYKKVGDRITYKHKTAGDLKGKIITIGLDSKGSKAPNGGYVRIVLDKDPSHKYLVSESSIR